MLALTADRRAGSKSPAALVMFELLSSWHRSLLRQLFAVQGSVQTPDHQIRSVVRPHQSGSTMQSNTCSGAHKYMWSCLNSPSIQSDWDFRAPHTTECVVEVTQLKPQFTPWKPIKAEVNLRAVCLPRCRAVLACLAEILSQVQVSLFLCCRRLRPNGVLQRERDPGDQRGWWAKFLRSPRHHAHRTANRVSGCLICGTRWTHFKKLSSMSLCWSP